MAKSLAQAHPIIIYLLVHFQNTTRDIKSHFYAREAYFGTALRPMFSIFIPVAHMATVRDLGNAAETNNGIT